MNYLIHKPKGLLKKYIKFIWALDFDNSNTNCEFDKLMPGGCVEIIINLGKKLSIKGKKNTDNLSSCGIVGGQKTTFSEYIPGSKGIISIVLLPEAAYSVIGIPISELVDCYVEPEDIWKPDGKDLVNRVIEAGNNDLRIKILEKFVFDKIVENEKDIDRRLLTSVDLLNKSGGQIKINELAEKICLSKRQIERMFKKEIGLSPKEFSRILRFQWILFAKQQNDSLSLTELAYIGGYFDQAHFINDFKTITGFNPKEYFSMGGIISDYYSI